MKMSDAPDKIFLLPKDAKLFGQKYGHPDIKLVMVGDDFETYHHDDKVRALVDALERIQDLTSHNMGMSAQDERCVNREASAAIAQFNQSP